MMSKICQRKFTKTQPLRMKSEIFAAKKRSTFPGGKSRIDDFVGQRPMWSVSYYSVKTNED